MHQLARVTGLQPEGFGADHAQQLIATGAQPADGQATLARLRQVAPAHITLVVPSQIVTEHTAAQRQHRGQVGQCGGTESGVQQLWRDAQGAGHQSGGFLT